MKIKLKNRQIEILRCLITTGIPLDISVLAKRFNKSERTIHYDLNVIRENISEYGIEIKNKSKKGLYIPSAQKPLCSRILTENVESEQYSLLDDTAENRYKTLFLYFLCQKQPVSIDKIADTFYVSHSTALRMVNSFTNYFASDCFTLQKTDGYKIEGKELELRKFAKDILVDLFDGSYTNEDWYLLLPDILKKEIKLQNIVTISHAIKKMNARYHVWISNHAFLSVLSYCIIRDIRIYKKCPILKEENETNELEKLNEYAYGVDLLQELYPAFFQYEYSELLWLLTVLKENGVFVSQSNSTSTELKTVISEMIELLTKKCEKLNYQFDVATLSEDLYEHMQRYLKMDKKTVDLAETMLVEETHNKYEDFYLLAQDCVTAFTKQYGISLPNVEICYIAIYLYKNLLQPSITKKRVLVVCATGKGLSNLLTTRIKNVFHNLTVVNQVSPYQLDPKYLPKDIDFIISTIPIGNCVLPVVKISTILSKEDIQRIQEFINYGKFIDSIPFNENNSASFSSKTDPFDLYKITVDTQKSDLSSASVILSKLIMTLLEYLSKLPKQYQMNPDRLLGLVIHMSMAIPRWCSDAQAEEASETVDGYYKLKEKYNSVFVIMEKFFRLVEDVLLISISISEKHSFFLYIINNEEEYNEKDTN